jgi:hypothetical protein
MGLANMLKNADSAEPSRDRIDWRDDNRTGQGRKWGLKAREQAFLIVPANDGFFGAIFLSSIDIITAAVDLFGPGTHCGSSILLNR